MFGLFKNHTIHYQPEAITVALNFKSAIEVRHSTQKTLAAFQALEATLRKDKTIDRRSIQRTEASNAKGNTDAVIAKLDALLPTCANQKKMTQRIIEKAVDQDKLEVLYSIYDANTEELSTQFNHVFTKNLNRLKEDLIAKLHEFDQKILQNSSKKFHKQLLEQHKLIPCQQIIHQTQQLIGSAKTISGVYASIAIGADLFAQMGVADDKWNTESTADVFIDTLPNVIQSHSTMSLGTHLNAVGSAFQLEQARNSLIAKLEKYLNKRARLDATNTTGSQMIHTYTPIDRGFFCNKKLQNERIRIAATLLSRLQCMQQANGAPIEDPALFANLLIGAIHDNTQCQEQHGKLFDKHGKLAKQLDNMRKELGHLYTQRVSLDGKIDLHEQLDLPEPAFTTYGTIQHS